jgi:hypothetical protein
VSGTARFPADPPTTNTGTLRLTIRGLAEINDSCRGSGNQRFTATYDGQLEVQPDGQFTAALYPTAPAVTVSSGCSAEDIRVEQISSVQLDAQLGDEVGTGGLAFQTLTAVDGDELKAGSFDDLVGQLTFTRP